MHANHYADSDSPNRRFAKPRTPTPVENTRRTVMAMLRSHKGDVAKTSIARHFGGRNCREGERGIVNRADPVGTAWDGSG